MYIHVYDYKLIVVINMRMCVYVCVHIESEIFVWEPFIQPYQYKEQMSDKSESVIFKNQLSHLLWSPRDIKSRSNFVSCLWVVESPDIGMFTPTEGRWKRGPQIQKGSERHGGG